MGKTTETSKEKFREWYRKLMTIRRFEEKVDEFFRQGKITGAVHTSVGQEAVAVGVSAALEERDLVVATHRGHGHCLMRGADLKAMMAELFGRATGLCKGKGGSMHIVDVKRGMLGAMGIVGAGMPIAAGVGLAIKMQKTGQVCVCFFGDNASNGGPFHEAHNVSSLWKLPVVFVCENNLYGISVSVKKSTSVEDIAVRAKGYNMPGVVVDGMDVLAVYRAAKEAVERARRGEGPSLLECKTYRFLGHSRGDPPYGPYRTKEELDSWKKRDPRLLLIKQGELSPEEVERIDKEVAEAIEEAIRYAEASPQPDIKVA
ncbi:MAG: thiamine pyrophosphate-dependent dehydrogenase E1 component subunit alpha, partial [Thermodesulfobacteriota bacterium]